jgi:hypothetical protein
MKIRIRPNLPGVFDGGNFHFWLPVKSQCTSAIIVVHQMDITGPQTWFARASRQLWWVVPIVFLLWIDRYGLKCWFMQDDFAWLALKRQVPESRSLLNALFAPQAQGTIRPWSDRGFFLLFESLFGFDSLPFRAWVLATMAVNTCLIAWIARRITGSRIAGFVAPVFWVANAALATVLSWSSAYNEALCALFLLSALILFIRFAETGRRVFWWWQLVVFTLGFGVLEVNIVYPALVAAYALFIARMTTKRVGIDVAPLFAISIAYFLLHQAVVPLPADGPYAIQVDGRMFATLANYWKWSLIPHAWTGRLLPRERAFFWVTTAALAAFFVRELTKRRYLVLFFGLWFLISLAPMLPIPGHTDDYYLTIPLIGLAMAGAWGAVCAWRSAWPWRVAVLLLAAAYLRVTAGSSLTASHWWLDRSLHVRAMVLGAAAAQQTHPDKTIVLEGITSALYDDAIAESAFYPLGLDYVYLTPDAGVNIHPTVNAELLPKIALEPPVMKNAITHDEVVVYCLVGDHLRNTTEAWERSAGELYFLGGKSAEEPRRVEIGNPLFAYLLGPEWFRLESGIRWMPRRATVRLGGPRTQEKLVLEGRCPVQLTGALNLSVSLDGISLGYSEVCNPAVDFHRMFAIPSSLAGRDSVQVVISVDRVQHEGGGRELGLVFGTIAFEPQVPIPSYR